MLGGNVTYMAKATLRKELTRQMNADLEVLKDEYEHAKALSLIHIYHARCAGGGHQPEYLQQPL